MLSNSAKQNLKTVIIMILKIVTDNKYRQFIYGYELTEKQKKDFDYIDDIDSHSFFKYKNQIYDPGDFMRINPSDSFNCNQDFKKWHAYASDTFFSGILIKYSDDCEQVIVGQYFS